MIVKIYKTDDEVEFYFKNHKDVCRIHFDLLYDGHPFYKNIKNISKSAIADAFEVYKYKKYYIYKVIEFIKKYNFNREKIVFCLSNKKDFIVKKDLEENGFKLNKEGSYELKEYF